PPAGEESEPLSGAVSMSFTRYAPLPRTWTGLVTARAIASTHNAFRPNRFIDMCLCIRRQEVQARDVSFNTLVMAVTAGYRTRRGDRTEGAAGRHIRCGRKAARQRVSLRGLYAA